jgi:hypothetical protein|tara:strand:- start:1058 stop:1759 length:702 start_codon:yes stop_codon:yes gene_type:complete
MKKNIVLISKSGSVKTQTAKNLVLNELYKKCKLKNSNDFEKRHTWKTHDNYVTIYAKNNGRAGQENKYDLPAPIDTDLYFNSMVAIKHSNQEPDEDSLIDFTKEEWDSFYNIKMGGSEDLGEEDSEEEIEDIPKELLSKQGYSKEDGFIVEDSDPLSTGKDDISEEEFIDETDTDDSQKEDEEDLDDEAAYGNESDYNEVEEVDGDEEDDSEDDEYDDDNGEGSELSEEEYKY